MSARELIAQLATVDPEADVIMMAGQNDTYIVPITGLHVREREPYRGKVFLESD